MEFSTENYVCCICKKHSVKLWRPYTATAPLICAECAEKRQAPREYLETIWQKVSKGRYEGKSTGKKLPMPKWNVDENGNIPSAYGPLPSDIPVQVTDQLSVDLSDISSSYSSGHTCMVPACVDENGFFWGYTSVPEEVCKWWRKLPTR